MAGDPLYFTASDLSQGMSSSVQFAVATGRMEGCSMLSVEGYNPAITTATDPEDIWGGGGTYNFSTTADIVSIASNDAADTQPILIDGLDEDYNEVRQIITLNGTTRVALTTPLIRVQLAQNFGSTNLAGEVFIYTGTGAVPSLGDATVRAVINGSQITRQAICTIPAGKVGFFAQGKAGLEFESSGPAAGNFARVLFLVRRFGGVFRNVQTVTLAVSGSTVYYETRLLSDAFPAKTDVKATVDEVSATMGLDAYFTFILVDEDLFDNAYLAGIGQPGY